MTTTTTFLRGGQGSVGSRAFWGVAYAYLVMMLGTTLPTPLYELYRNEFGLPVQMVTIVFAIYAFGVVLALALFGSLSDRLGRRPVALGALLLAALSSVVFLLADDVGLLLLGRLISGLGAGLISGVAAATITELEPRGDTDRASVVSTAANVFGLGLGPLMAGLLAAYAPAPTRLPFIVYVGLLLPAFVAIWAAPETVADRVSRSHWRPRWPGVAPELRGAFVIGAAAVFVSFTIVGFFAALAPTFLGSELTIRSPAVTGAVVFSVFAASGCAQLVLRALRARIAIAIGLAATVLALLLIVLGLRDRSLLLFLGAALIGGAGSGLTFMGSLEQINRLVSPSERARTISAYFVVCYLGLAIPVVGLGFAVQALGLYPSAVAFAVVIGGLALVAGFLDTRGSGARTTQRSAWGTKRELLRR
ncbi:MAG: hypothetical protein QOG15_2001 [Solirubrobacteraceae bacterium]|nr:hypothetical protein [Solirubrobacteraceae bacterium]